MKVGDKKMIYLIENKKVSKVIKYNKLPKVILITNEIDYDYYIGIDSNYYMVTNLEKKDVAKVLKNRYAKLQVMFG